MSHDDILDADFEEVRDAFNIASEATANDSQPEAEVEDRQLVIEFLLTDEQQKSLKAENEGPGYYDVRLVDPSAKMHQFTAEFPFFHPSTKISKAPWQQEFPLENGNLFQLVIMGGDLGRPGDQEQDLIHWLMSQISAAKDLNHKHLDKHIRFRVADYLEYQHKKKYPNKPLPKKWSGNLYDGMYKSIFRLKAASYFTSIDVENSFVALNREVQKLEVARGTKKKTTGLILKDVISFARSSKQKLDAWSWISHVHAAEDGIVHITLSEVAWQIFNNQTAHLQEDDYIFKLNSAMYKAIARYMERHIGDNTPNFVYAIREDKALERYGLSSLTKRTSAMERSRIRKLNSLQPFVGGSEDSGFSFFCCSDPNSREVSAPTYHFAMRADKRAEWANAASAGDIPLQIKQWFAAYSSSEASLEAYELAAMQNNTQAQNESAE